MQVRTPARQPGPRVGLDDVPSSYEAKQAGLDRTLLAAYTGTHRGHTRDVPLGSRGHYIHKSTVSAGLGLRTRTAPPGPLWLVQQPATPGAAELFRDPAFREPGYSGACAAGPAGEGPAGTTASDLMSMRQPVSLAASLAFWPSLPIASDSW